MKTTCALGVDAGRTPSSFFYAQLQSAADAIHNSPIAPNKTQKPFVSKLPTILLCSIAIQTRGYPARRHVPSSYRDGVQ